MSRRCNATNAAAAIFFTAALLSGPASATWSVLALNPETGTFAVAAASCSNDVNGIQRVVPGKGAVIVQASSNAEARNKAVAMLQADASPDTILRTLVDPASGFAPERQQYALLATGEDHRARTFTGKEVPDSKGTYAADYVSVQVNTMVSDHVLRQTRQALGAPDWADDLSLARRLMTALEAGAAAGGDKRCGSANSATAVIGLYRKTDPDDAPWMELSVHGIAPGTHSGVAALRPLFDRWLKDGTAATSTRVSVIPASAAHPDAQPPSP